MVALIKDKKWRTLTFLPERRLLLIDCNGRAKVVKIDDFYGRRFFIIYAASKPASGKIFAGLKIGKEGKRIAEISEDRSITDRYYLVLVFDEVTFSQPVENALRYSAFYNVDRTTFFEFRRKLVYGDYEKARGVALL